MDSIEVPETDPSKKFANYALFGAGLQEDDNAVRLSLIRGADPKFKLSYWKETIEEYIQSTTDMEIKKHLVQNAVTSDKKVSEIESEEILKNYALLGAAVAQDVDAMREFLSRGADPNFKATYCEFDNLFEQDNLEICKLLVEYGYIVNERNISYVFIRQPSSFVREIVPHIFNYCVLNDELVQCFFYLLMGFKLEPTHELEIFKLLLDHGLPVNDYLMGIEGEDDEHDSSNYTPLHYIISRSERTESLIPILLDRGADPNKRTLCSEGSTPLIMAVQQGNYDLIELLLEKGARINDPRNDGYTPLHIAAFETNLGLTFADDVLILFLLERGADVNAETVDGRRTPFMFAGEEDIREVFVRKFAMLKFEGQHISESNLDRLRDVDEDDYFDNCLGELKRMKDYEIFNRLSLYDILKMHVRNKKLVSLTKKEEFIAAFELDWDRESFSCYANQLNNTVREASKLRDKIHEEKEKIYESGLDKEFSVPPEIMEIIVEYATDHLYFK